MVDVESVRKDWAARGFSCAEWVDPKGQTWENYVHDVDELLMVLEGALSLEVHGVSHKVPAGVEYFIPARAVHSVRNLHDGASRWLYGYKKK